MLLAVYVVPLGALPASAAGDADIFVFDQCFTRRPAGCTVQTCRGWTNGILNDSNTDYNEDEVTPQRSCWTSNFSAPTIDISYQTLDHNVHAYDSFWPRGTTRGLAPTAVWHRRHLRLRGGRRSARSSPLDGTVHHDVGVGKSPNRLEPPADRPGPDDVAAASRRRRLPRHGHLHPDYQTLRVTLTAAANSKVMLLFGGHIAATFRQFGWGEKADGTNLGAAQVPGGSCQVGITNMNRRSDGEEREQADVQRRPSRRRRGRISTNATAGPVTISGRHHRARRPVAGHCRRRRHRQTSSLSRPDDTTCSGLGDLVLEQPAARFWHTPASLR